MDSGNDVQPARDRETERAESAAEKQRDRETVTERGGPALATGAPVAAPQAQRQRPNHHGAARRAKRPLAAIEASHVAGVFVGIPFKGAGGPVTFNGSEKSRWVTRFRERWQKEQVNERHLLQNSSQDVAQETQRSCLAAAKMVRRSDQVLRHWHHHEKRQRLNRLDAGVSSSSGGGGGCRSGGESTALPPLPLIFSYKSEKSLCGAGNSWLARSERLELSSDDEDTIEKQRRKPFEAAEAYPPTDDEPNMDDDSDSDSDDSLSPSPSLEDGVSSLYIVPTHGHLPEGLSWNAFQKHFKGYPNAAVAKQWQQYQADGGRWMTGRVGGWGSGAVSLIVQPYRSNAQPSTSSSSQAQRRRKPEVDDDEDADGPSAATRAGKRTGPWTPAEDALLKKLVTEFGLQDRAPKSAASADSAVAEEPAGWAQVSSRLGLRTSKQCRERWRNHLDPQLRKGAWGFQEQKIFVDAHRMLGNAWADIAKLLPGR